LAIANPAFARRGGAGLKANGKKRWAMGNRQSTIFFMFASLDFVLPREIINMAEKVRLVAD
jgi:hypothetical protein